MRYTVPRCIRCTALITVALCLAAPATAAETAPADARLNILWITTEDISPDLGCYGERYARTPNLDRFAAEGVRFERAFSIAGVCAPSRSAIITGMYPTTISTHHMRSKAVPPPYVRCFPEYLRADGYYCTNNVKTDYNFDAPLTAWDESSRKAHWRNRPDGMPFFAVFNIVTTHESRIRATDEEFAKLTRRVPPDARHDPAKAPLPPYYPDTPVVRQDWARYSDLITAMDLEVADLLKQLDDDGLADNTIVFFYGDHGRGLPRAKRWLYDSGIRVPLLVRWPGVLQPGSVREDLVSFVDFAPTVLALAGVAAPAHMQGQVFLGPKRAPDREYIYAARDRMDETYDIIRCVRDRRYRYIRNLKPGRPYAQYIDYMEQMPTMREMRRLNKAGTLTGPQKLFFLPEKPEEELYDLDRDPHEIKNLAGSPEHVDVLKRMREAMQTWMKETNDLGLVSEDELNERMRPGGKWATTDAPVFTPAEGTFDKPVTLRITCPTDGASIAYTTDDGPGARWRLCTGRVRI
ncbi:MAG: sulfatase-like hydrolase/transferase, partial [Phycisphaerae bacterium]|nr:sulfatase-like hydrolase/transferase [Phycisphaerae bacterium]